MNHFVNAELARIRTDEMLAAAHQYRGAGEAISRRTRPKARSRSIGFKAALVALAVGAIVVVGVGSAARARPSVAGPSAGSAVRTAAGSIAPGESRSLVSFIPAAVVVLGISTAVVILNRDIRNP